MSDNLTHLGQSEMAEILKLQGSNIDTWALALMTVSFRFIARQISKQKFWYDDYLILIATLFATVFCFSFAIWIAIGLVKFSILAFYWRLFIQKPQIQSSRTRLTAVTIWFLTTIVACWGIVTILLELLCDPSNLHLDFTDCHVNSGRFFVGSTIPHVITDVVLLGFPILHIWKLPIIRRPQKTYLTAVFAAGTLVTIVSVVRLIYLIRTYGLDGYGGDINRHVSFTSIFVLTNLETNLSIVCGYLLSLLACIPCLRPILSLISKKLTWLHKRKSTHKRGVELLVDMLPAEKTAAPPTSPLSRQESRDGGYRPDPKSFMVSELEANTSRIPELGGEAPGPQILEVETLEPVHEMGSNHPPVAEMDGWSRLFSKSRGWRG